MVERSIDLFFVFCLAGLGKRFIDEGIYEPKYLLDFPGEEESILDKAIKSFSLKKDTHLIFCCNKKHLSYEKYLKKIIKENHLKADIIFTQDTSGQAETAYFASKYILSKYQEKSSNTPIVFFNGDTILKNRNLEAMSNELKKVAGFIDCFESCDPRYSFIEHNKLGHIINIEEKVCISNIATSGLYFFSSPMLFMTEYEHTKKLKSNETYISHVYNEMIKRKLKIKFHLEQNPKNTIILGTPEEYMNHLNSIK